VLGHRSVRTLVGFSTLVIAATVLTPSHAMAVTTHPGTRLASTAAGPGASALAVRALPGATQLTRTPVRRVGGTSTQSPTGPTAPDPTPPAPPVQQQSTTMFGASLETDGGTMAQAVARETSKYGTKGTFRYYSPGLPPSWSSLTQLTNRPLVISFKADPVAVVRGDDDAYLTAWFAAAPRDRVTWWTYFHEPENDVEAGAFTAAQFRAAFTHVAALADKAANPELRATLILMGWTAVTPTRNISDYYPGANVVDVLGWDVYNRAAALGKMYSPPDQVFGKVVALSRSLGKPWAIAETGAPLIPGDTGAGRAAYLESAGSYLRSSGAVFVTYFDCTHGGAYTLNDIASIRAWADQF
jgi:hypothetical protein